MSVALIIGGAETVREDYARARTLCANEPVVHFLINDQIGLWDADTAEGVTLHLAKLTGWLETRRRAGFPPLRSVWSIRQIPGVDRVTTDWRGSTGLLAVKVAMESGFRQIVLCGVPMTAEAGHFVRHRPWNDARTFHRGWLVHRPAIAPFVRSCSGWTAELLGEPTAEWLRA